MPLDNPVRIDVDPAEQPAGAVHSPIIELRDGDSTLLALFDGSGSWGTGRETAAWTRDRLHDQWQHAHPRSIAVIADDINRAVGTVPHDLRDGPFGWGFSGVVALLDGAVAHVAAAGMFATFMLAEGRATPIYRPRMLLDDYLARESLTPAEIEAFPHKHVYVGPLIGEQLPAQLAISGPHELARGCVIAIADRQVMEGFLSQPPAIWDRSAVELQSLVGNLRRKPLVLIRREP